MIVKQLNSRQTLFYGQTPPPVRAIKQCQTQTSRISSPKCHFLVEIQEGRRWKKVKKTSGNSGDLFLLIDKEVRHQWLVMISVCSCFRFEHWPLDGPPRSSESISTRPPGRLKDELFLCRVRQILLSHVSPLIVEPCRSYRRWLFSQARYSCATCAKSHERKTFMEIMRQHFNF